jgi:uncharacterized protein
MDMKRIEKPQKKLIIGRRGFLKSAGALSIGAGLSAPAIVTRAFAQETTNVALSDQDLRFIGEEET